jgi:hypothetical protein
MRDQLKQVRRDDVRGVVLGLAVLAALALLDVSLNPATDFAAALVMAPVLCAALAGPRAVAGVGALAVAAAGFLVSYDAHVGAPGLKVAVVVAGTGLAMLISRDRNTRAARLARVESVAEAVQRALLPNLPGRVGPASVAAWYVSATEEALIGGDFYDVICYRHSARWVIGDVKGKGIEAVRMTAAVLGAFREAAVRLGSLREVAERMDERVSSLAAEEDFVTALIGELGPDGAVRLINCGHPPPLRLTSGAPVALTTGWHSSPLGLHPVFRTEAFQLDGGECLWCFTDGAAEARTAVGSSVDIYKLGSRLAETGAARAAETIRERLADQRASNHLDDDTAVLVIEYDRPLVPFTGGGLAARVREGL